MINPKVIEILKNNGFNVDDVLIYLVSLYLGLKPSYIPELVKKQANVVGIVNRDFDKGTIKWIVPLYLPKEDVHVVSTEKTPEPEDKWSWVITEYRTMFTKIRKTAGGDASGCIAKMKKFFSDNPEVRKDDILKATRLYLEDFNSGKNDPRFLQQANYFIFKGVKGKTDYQSRLSQYLELIDESKEDNVSQRNKRGLL